MWARGENDKLSERKSRKCMYELKNRLMRDRHYDRRMGAAKEKTVGTPAGEHQNLPKETESGEANFRITETKKTGEECRKRMGILQKEYRTS